MRTLLSQFCEEFDAIIRALIQPARNAAQALATASDEVSGKELQPALVDLAHQFEALADKVAEQQAYVLIFGPLKSGKSTLMNALSATYVSEVSSLPAYPCMVYVSHSETREYTVTRYTGQTEVHKDPQSLHLAIHRAHGELAERLRSNEGQEATFDPAVDFPQAIRRIDFKLPAGELAESGAVMVDTPGLYSRMKFGYDRMTRDFRNAAACAIFVVKTDNLFLEQVFAEFTELLELFSRIFLVVNLDSTKRDLFPDGSLRPSLEQENPLRIIEAFEDLAMSAPLKKAADDGRLKIYPVDLLHAAAERLGGDAEDGSASRTSFGTFQEDLTNYLNSTDYLVAFLGDSLRRSKSLLDELDELEQAPSVEKLRAEATAVTEDLARAQARNEALEALGNHDWSSAFGELEQRLGSGVRQRSSSVEDRTRQVLDGAVDAWFRNDDSLETLNREVISAALRGHQEDLLVYLEKALRDAVSAGDAGITVSPTTRSQLDAARLNLVEVGASALGELDLLGALLDPDPAIEPAQIPVKKGFWDWVLFRSSQRMQTRLFGPKSRPNLRIAKADKTKRLGKLGREAMLRALDAATGGFFDEASAHIRTELLEAYTRRATTLAAEAIANKLEGNQRRRADLMRQHEEHRAVIENFDALLGFASHAKSSVDDLWQEYGTADPDSLIEPVEELPQIELEPMPPVTEEDLPELPLEEVDFEVAD